MEKKLTQLCKKICEMNPPVNLAGFVFSRIKKEKTRRAKRQLVFSYVGLGSSLLLAMLAGIFFGQAFFQSEFWVMLSLAFSDVAVVLANWDTFLLSLLETFPVVHAIIFLVPVFILLISANFYFTNKACCKHKFSY
ncbi:MAG: hypothetical protein WC848_04095 [Parcubacteria group bacterium]|jgi:hypothetical protein